MQRRYVRDVFGEVVAGLARVMGTVSERCGHTPQSGCWLELLAEAAVPEPTLDTDTGNEEMHPLSYVITGTKAGECVFVHARVCVSVCVPDRPTDCRSPELYA